MISDLRSQVLPSSTFLSQKNLTELAFISFCVTSLELHKQAERVLLPSIPNNSVDFKRAEENPLGAQMRWAARQLKAKQFLNKASVLESPNSPWV